jgi:transposase
MDKVGLIEKCKKLEQENAELVKGKAALEVQVKLLLEERRLANSRRFNTSSENSGHFICEMLFNEAEALSAPDALEPAIETVTYVRKKAGKAQREIDLSTLEVEDVYHTLDPTTCLCPVCSGALHDMGEETSSELIFVPAKYIHRIHHIHKYSCRDCDATGENPPVIKANLWAKPIPYSVASPSLLAHIACDKYVKAIPLYRQQQAFASLNLCITRQTMANWMIKCAGWFEAIYGKLHETLKGQSVIHADETTLQVLHEDGREAKQKSYMWLYRSAVCENRQVVLYDYQTSRGFSCARDFLKGFSGICHADGHRAYRKLEDVVLIGCWAHARRKFAEALEATDESQREESVAAEGLRYINTLFSLERDFTKTKLTVDERQLARQQRSLPVAISMINWANSLHVLPKSLTGKALTYLREQWPYLKEALLHGECEISNNRAERSIKPFVIGRKNWLFSNTATGARASAVIYSVIETAKASCLIPESYLCYLLEQLPNTTTCALDDLMPWSATLPAGIKMPDIGDKTKEPSQTLA